MNRNVEALLSGTADTVLNHWPRQRPSRTRLEQVCIVSHRGEYDNVRVRENTTAAFDAAVAAGNWGLEFDVRYTADNEPVVVHDADLRRVFDNPSVIAETSWKTLHGSAPEVPHLEAFLARYADRAHLMLEIKVRAPGSGENRLLHLLDKLEPITDFHILAVDTRLFTAVRVLPNRCRLPVAKLNTRAMLDYAMAHDCGGLAGPYLLVGTHSVARLQAAGRQIGTGFVTSRSVLWREAARGVNWIFSDRAGELQRTLDLARDS